MKKSLIALLLVVGASAVLYSGVNDAPAGVGVWNCTAYLSFNGDTSGNHANFMNYYDETNKTMAIRVCDASYEYYIYQNPNPQLFNRVQSLIEKHFDQMTGYANSACCLYYGYIRFWYATENGKKIIKAIDFKYYYKGC